MPLKTLLEHTPVDLTKTHEHRIIKRKWWAVLILITGGILLASKAPVPPSIPYILFFFGHGGMLHSFWNKRDIPMVIVNAVWVLIDVLGMVRWS